MSEQKVIERFRKSFKWIDDIGLCLVNSDRKPIRRADDEDLEAFILEELKRERERIAEILEESERNTSSVFYKAELREIKKQITNLHSPQEI